MVVVGLTGGIGSGKSSVAALLAERGAVVVDADEVARQVVEPGGAAHDAVVDRFGPDVVDADNRVDRRALARLVFADRAARAALEAIVHPAVNDVLLQQLEAHADTDRVVVAVVPLLVEVAWDHADVVVVVDCPEEVAVRRLVEGRGMAEDDVRRRMASQASRAERLARADRVVANDGSRDDLVARVDGAWEWMARLSHPSIRAGEQHREDPLGRHRNG